MMVKGLCGYGVDTMVCWWSRFIR